MSKRIKIDALERVVAVVPEYYAGPGWSNAVIWVHIVGPNGHRAECIQPQERTPGMHSLFATLAAAHSGMMAEVNSLIRQRKGAIL